MKPKFKIGFELEGIVRHGQQQEFDDGLQRVAPGINRGTDGSVDGYFAASTSMPGRVHGNGIEIRTPPLPLLKGMALFDKVLAYLKEATDAKFFKTNTTCGLHVNLSEEATCKEMNLTRDWYVHILCNFPERKVLKMFNRDDNSYCQPNFTRDGKHDYKTVRQALERGDFGSKYVAVGQHFAYEQEYRRVEFRCLGGTDYHLKREKLDTAIAEIITASTIAFEKTLGLDKPRKDIVTRTFQRVFAA